MSFQKDFLEISLNIEFTRLYKETTGRTAYKKPRMKRATWLSIRSIFILHLLMKRMHIKCKKSAF